MSTDPIILDVEQGSDRWAALRCGRITASRAGDMIAMKTRGAGEKAERMDYRTELLVERITGIPVEQFVTKEMRWGLEQEPFAREAYELHSAQFVDLAGFVIHPDLSYFGCSPDGLVGDVGMIQIKCPTRTKHLEWLKSGTIPVEHIAQMLAELACSGRTWCDFVSFHPQFPEHLQLYVRRYQRDESMIEMLLAEVRHFNAEIEQELKALPPGPQAAKILEMPRGDEAEF